MDYEKAKLRTDLDALAKLVNALAARVEELEKRRPVAASQAKTGRK